MTPSKLTDAVERGIEKMKSHPIGAIAATDGDIIYEVSSTMLSTFARDLILAVREIVPEERPVWNKEAASQSPTHATGSAQNLGFNEARAQTLRSLDAFLGDNG